MSAVMDAVDWAARADELIDEIESLETDLAPLRASFANGRVQWDADRKKLVSMLSERTRQELRQGNVAMGRGGVTDGQIDDKAHAHSDYRDFLADSADRATEYYTKEAKLSALTRRYELAKSRVYLSGRLAGLQ
jgi:hypothetical protein